MSMTRRLLFLAAVLTTLAAGRPSQGVQPLSRIPFKLIGEHVFITVQVNGSDELNFLFDTGCTEAVMDSITAENLGLVSRGQVKDYGDGSFAEQVIPHATMMIGEFRLDEIKFNKQSLKYLELFTGQDLDGVIGNEILQNYVVRIDYDKMIFEIYDRAGYTYDGRGEVCDITANRYFSAIDAAVVLDNTEVVQGKFLIDTGAELTVAFSTPFVSDNNLLSKTGKRLECRLHARNATFTAYQTRIRSFRLGDSDFSKIPVLLAQTKSGALSTSALSGIVGNEVLKRFNVVFDYSRQRIYLEPNHLFGAPFKVNCSGLEVRLTTDQGIVIDRVHPNSPASEVGLAAGDEIIEINDSDVKNYSIYEIRDLLSRPGEKVHLLVRRGKTNRKVSFKLRELI
jgi:predicted aspartyl protease